MKELLIEEKARRYNEALERAKQFITKELYAECNGNLVEYIFPELAESEDERIRKDLIAFVDANTLSVDERHDRWIAWLEKQGEQAKIEALRTEYEKGRADAIAELKQKPFDYSNANIQQKDFAMPLHSQRKSLQQVLNDFKNDFDYFVRYAENYIAEQKLTEWNEDGEKIRKEIMDFIDINTIVSDERRNRWFSYLEKQGKQKPAEEYNITGIGSKHAEGKLGEMIKNLKPDNEVLEQKPTDKYEGLTDFERTLADICVGWIGEELGWKQYIKDNADVLLKIAIKKFNSVQDVAFEQKPAWSEEDEAHINGIIDYLYDYKLSVNEEDMNVANGVQEEIDWLKSLKDRVRTQPRQEWSEEDEGFFNDTIAFIEDARDCRQNALDCIDWLKSLKDRYTWKPSDEQMITLRHVISGCSYDIEPLVELETKLKEL